MNDSDFRQRLIQARVMKGLSQRALAEELGLKSDGYITNIEKGRKSPNHRLLADIGLVLGCSVDYLLYGKKINA